MEKWKEVFVGIIPKAVYQVQLINGEKQGLTIKLSSSQTCVMINFGMVQAVRMLDEGIVQSNLYSENEIRKYKDNDFRNIIYEVQDGEFSEQINQISNTINHQLVHLRETIDEFRNFFRNEKIDPDKLLSAKFILYWILSMTAFIIILLLMKYAWGIIIKASALKILILSGSFVFAAISFCLLAASLFKTLSQFVRGSIMYTVPA